MSPDETFIYELPALVDPEGNDEPEVLIEPYGVYPYPNFMNFDAESRTLTMTPDVYDGGMFYYF